MNPQPYSESGKPQTLERRIVQGFLPMPGHGLDVGAGSAAELAAHPGWRWWEKVEGMTAETWDLRENGDAHHLEGVPDASFDWLNASHILEHLHSPELAFANWVRVVKPGGLLLISVPHRVLYEGRQRLPSRWNGEHCRFYLPRGPQEGDTVDFYAWCRAQAGARLELFATGDWGAQYEPRERHAVGEFQIDARLVRL